VPRTRTDNGQPSELPELAARVEASDVSPRTLELLEARTNELVRAYTPTPPGALLRDVRTSARQISKLLGGRATLTQQTRLLAAGGWLAVFAATLHIDLGQRWAAGVARDTARSLGRETGAEEIGAWAVEIDAWTALVDQDWPLAARLAAAGEAIAPAGSPAAAQLAMQSARAGRPPRRRG
jgi:hypothetical protein